MPSRLIPDFDDDIFFNYSHADNDLLDESNKGWVDTLYERLKSRLRQLTGVEPEIYLDKRRMSGNGRVTETLVIELHKVFILLPILSPSYLTSDWCIKELIWFYEHAAKTGGDKIKNKSRIFKVIKTPVDESSCPAELRELPGYKFYDVDSLGKIDEFKHRPLFPTYPKFIYKSEDLAEDIKVFVNECGRLNPCCRTVYLAETISDLEGVRESIRGELQEHHYRVLPDKPLPKDGKNFSAAVKDYLRQSGLSVHLIGGVSDFIPAGEKRDAVYLQHELALDRRSDPDFFRVIWTPIGLKAQGTTQRAFLKYLRTQPRVQERAELLLGNTNRENLKKYLVDKMKKLASSGSPPTPTETASYKPPEISPDVEAYTVKTTGEPENGPVVDPVMSEPIRIYLMCDKKDFETDTFVPLRDYLVDIEGYHVTLPIMDSKTTTKQIFAEHNRNLSECDVSIILWGESNEGWMRSKLSELKKIIASERTKPRPINIIYITGLMDKTKDSYRNTPEYQVVKTPGEFSAEPLSPLLDAIQKRFSQNKG